MLSPVYTATQNIISNTHSNGSGATVFVQARGDGRASTSERRVEKGWTNGVIRGRVEKGWTNGATWGQASRVDSLGIARPEGLAGVISQDCGSAIGEAAATARPAIVETSRSSESESEAI